MAECVYLIRYSESTLHDIAQQQNYFFFFQED